MEAAVRIRKHRVHLSIAGLVLSVLAGLYVARPSVELKAAGMGPILPVDVKTGEPSFLGAAVRDPEALRRRPEDEQDATRLAYEIKEARGDLARAKGERALELNEQAYQGYAALSYFLEDVAAGAAPGDRQQARQNLAAVRGFLAQHAMAVAKLTKSEPQRARAIFHAMTARYLLGRDRGQAAQALRELAEGRSKLPKALASRAKILVAMHDLDAGRDRRAAARSLAAAARSLSGAGAVTARLAAARGYAGLSKDGRRVARADHAYRAQLAAAASAAQGLAAAPKDEALGLMLGIWRRAEGDGSDWGKVPFKMAAFTGSLAVKGVVERSALDDFRRGRLADAIRKYESLAASLSGQPRRAELDLRVLDLRRADYVKSRNPKSYEAALLAKQRAYLDPGLLGEGNEAKVKATTGEIRQRHAALVYGEMARVATRGARNAERDRALTLAQTFLGTLDDNKEIEGVKEKMAQLHVLSGQHREAVALYRELAETGSSARKYYGLAIASQSVLARWPMEAPWQGIPAGDAAARDELLALYGKYDQTSGSGKRSWPVLAQQGLLMAALGQAEQAFSLWSEQLAKDATGPHAANAAGYMLVAYQKAKSWGELEALARLCLAARLGPVYRGAPVAAFDALGLALLEGGSQALEAGQFPVAVKKLAEYVAQHARSARHDEGMLKLAHAYRGNGQHKDSIGTLTSLVERHPRSRYMREALLTGGDWSAPMAYEENAMFFYGRFLGAYDADPEADRVRVTLTELYMGRGLYLDAAGMLMARVRASGVPAAEKSQALSTVLDIEERHGSLARAEKAADLLIAASDAVAEHKAEAYSLKARLAAKKGDFARVGQIEALLAGLGTSFPVTDARGEARYLIASSLSRGLVQEHFNLELRDPLRTLTERYAAWKQVRAAYDSVCEAGETSYCAPAMNDMARLAVQFLRSIEDIDIQATLAAEVVRKFKSHKQFVYNDVAKAAQRADSRALASVRKGQSSPDTTQAVLWQNSSDWNFDRVSGEAGNAYVQWSTRTAAEAE